MQTIQTCLKRSSLSLNWVKGYLCGYIPLLSEVDVFFSKQSMSLKTQLNVDI